MIGCFAVLSFIVHHFFIFILSQLYLQKGYSSLNLWADISFKKMIAGLPP